MANPENKTRGILDKIVNKGLDIICNTECKLEN